MKPYVKTRPMAKSQSGTRMFQIPEMIIPSPYTSVMPVRLETIHFTCWRLTGSVIRRRR